MFVYERWREGAMRGQSTARFQRCVRVRRSGISALHTFAHVGCTTARDGSDHVLTASQALKDDPRRNPLFQEHDRCMKMIEFIRIPPCTSYFSRRITRKLALLPISSRRLSSPIVSPPPAANDFAVWIPSICGSWCALPAGTVSGGGGERNV